MDNFNTERREFSKKPLAGKLALLWLVLLCAMPVFAQKWSSPVPLLVNYHLKDVAMANYSDSLKSYVIEYNPGLAREVGPFVTTYLQAHEYGHILRTHVNKKTIKQKALNARLQLGRQLELGADSYAIETLYIQDKSVLLAMQGYLRKNTDRQDLLHLSNKERLDYLTKSIALLTSTVTQNVACKHLLHDFDETACSHLNAEGKPMHATDSVRCLHVTHIGGDVIKVRAEDAR